MADKISSEQLVAHRGFQRLYPENTALSVTKAIEAGAKFVEIDIQLCQNKKPVVYHDSTLQRVSELDDSIFDLPLQQLESLSAYEPQRLGMKFIDEKISSLSAVVEIIRQHRDVTLFVEIKEESIIQHNREKVLQAVRTQLQPISQQSVLISFDYQIIQQAKVAGWPQLGVVLRSWEDINSQLVAAIAPDYCFVDHQIIPQDHDLFRLNSKLVAYEVADKQLAAELLQRGVCMVETFNIELLLS